MYRDIEVDGEGITGPEFTLQYTADLDQLRDRERLSSSMDIRTAQGWLNDVQLNRTGTYMKDFAFVQEGEVGDITAGLPPYPYVKYPYIEWYSKLNGRVVLELDEDQIEINEPKTEIKTKAN